MKNTRIASILMFVTLCCNGQQSQIHKIKLELKKNIDCIKLSQLSFVPKELIEVCLDSGVLSRLKKMIAQQNQVKRKTKADQQEFDLTLHVLYGRILAETSGKKDRQRSRHDLLELLINYKDISFSISEQLILEQTDISRRNLINGYDEGSINESTFTFFIYDPLGYKKTLVSNNQIEDWKRMGVFLCNYLRDNEIPIAIRGIIKSKILNSLSEDSVEHEFRDVVKRLADCKVEENLYD